MISKGLFLKGMREDLRHRIWLLALSLLGSFLAMPVVWLLRYSDVDLSAIHTRITEMTSQEYQEAVSGSISSLADYFSQELMLSASLITLACAVFTGLEGFHYLQQKSMVDTYHSLPVSRAQLFGIKYVNGLLIWLVPYLFCTALALALSGVLLAQVGGTRGIPGLIMEAGKNTLVLLVAFLLVYHLMLLATMLTGNMLNTLTVAVTLGCGAICTYGMTLGFMTTFFHTYYARTGGLAAIVYASPLVSPFLLVNSRVDADFQISDSLTTTALLCLATALALGALAWFSYRKRPSERAGKGLELQWIAWPLRLIVSILGGMGGWLLMYYLVRDSGYPSAWCLFGALLTGTMAYGVLDVIFAMDFKAFFRHKWSMGASMLIMLLICAGFQEDWIGYDCFLPDQGQIREASIACRAYAYGSNPGRVLDGVRLTDSQQIHAFLERGIENMRGRAHKPETASVAEAYEGDSFAADKIFARVVLENGRSYYRIYSYYEWDADVVLPLLCSEEYANGAFGLGDELVESCEYVRFTSGTGRDSIQSEVWEKELIRELVQAYNQDLSENPQAVVLGQGRLLGQMILKTVSVQSFGNICSVDILENMTHIQAVMEKNGIRVFCQPREAEEVESITFLVDGSGYWYNGDASISPAERSIRGHFGVFPENLPESYGDETDSGAENLPESYGDETDSGAERLPENGYEAGVPSTWEAQLYSFTVTDPEEIARVLPLIQYSDTSRQGGVFSEGLVQDVRILDRRGMEWGVCLRRGALPEELIQRFLEEARGQ